MHLEETVLDDVVGVVATTCRADHEGKHVTPMPLEKFEESTFISRGCTPSQVLVGGLIDLVAVGGGRVH